MQSVLGREQWPLEVPLPYIEGGVSPRDLSRALCLVYDELLQSGGGRIKCLLDFADAGSAPAAAPVPFAPLARQWPEGSPQRLAVDCEYLRAECLQLEVERLDAGVTAEIAKDLFAKNNAHLDGLARRLHRDVELCNARRKAAQLQHRRVVADLEDQLASVDALRTPADE